MAPVVSGVPRSSAARIRARGLIKNESTFDLQLLELDGRFALLTKPEIQSVEREPKSLMPPLQSGETEAQDLLAFLSRLTGIHARSADEHMASLPEDNPLPGAVTFAQIADPKPGE